MSWGRADVAGQATRGGYPYPGLTYDASQRHAESWPRHVAKQRKRRRRRSSLTRGRQSGAD